MTTESAPETAPPASPPAGSEPAPSSPPVDTAPEGSPGETAPAPEGEPTPEGIAAKPEPTKSEAAKKGHTTRQKRAARRAELAEDADVQILLDQAIKRGETKAKADAAEEAKRATMSELERAQAEASDFKAQLAAKDVELASQRGEREYGDALIDSGLKVRAKSRKIFRQQVAEAMANDETLSHADAIGLTATEHDYLIAPTQQGAAAQSGQPAPQHKRPGASTTPAPKRETAAPAQPDPKKPIDVMAMSKTDYREYRRQKYGISLPS